MRQGVTTEVIGVDGLSYAPLNPHALRDLVEMNAGLDGRPDIAYDWTNVASYLERLNGTAVNLAMLVGNTALRIDSIGWEDDPAAIEMGGLIASDRVARTPGCSWSGHSP